MSINGVFHVHSNFSHDGRNSIDEIIKVLEKKDFKFIVLTDHFEDFNKDKFFEYISTIEKINKKNKIIIIPGIEVEFKEFHIVLAPVNDYHQTKNFIETGSFKNFTLRIIAHPSKNSLNEFENLIKNYPFNGIEMWNQRADGSFYPPMKLIKKVTISNFLPYLKFFGVDIHNIHHPINNIIKIHKITNDDLNVDSIMTHLTTGNFINLNLKTGFFIDGNSSNIAAFNNIKIVQHIYGKLQRIVMLIFKYLYNVIPRNKRIKFESLKNEIKKFF